MCDYHGWKNHQQSGFRSAAFVQRFPGKAVSLRSLLHQDKGERVSVVRDCAMKNCKLCRFSKVCNDLPGICILIQYLAVGVLVVSLGYLFLSQELFS